MSTKIHYFVVAGYIDPDGNVRLGDDPAVADAVLDGTLYDETTGEWLVCRDEDDVATDDEIISVLRQRLANEEMTA